MDGIALWWIGEEAMDASVMAEVGKHVERAFGMATSIRSDPRRPTGTYDPARGQHSSTSLLRWLASERPPEGGALVGVTDRDLFIPVLTFVYGEAKLGGGVAVVSTARLGEGPGRAAEGRLLVSRLAKECVHELGHAFGLLHCAEARCVMARSMNLLQVDAKGSALCRDCQIRLRERRREEGGGAHGQ